MSFQAKRELRAQLAGRYTDATGAHKSQILEESSPPPATFVSTRSGCSALRLRSGPLLDHDHGTMASRCKRPSAKRYALFNRNDEGEPKLRKSSEHGLGHLLNPIDPECENGDWMEVLWEGLARGRHEHNRFGR
jgi:hypothetical protein